MSGAGPSKAVEVHKQKLATITVDTAALWVLKAHKAQHGSSDSLSQRKEKPCSHNVHVNVLSSFVRCSQKLKTTQLLLTQGLANLLRPSSGVLVTNKEQVTDTCDSLGE